MNHAGQHRRGDSEPGNGSEQRSGRLARAGCPGAGETPARRCPFSRCAMPSRMRLSHCGTPWLPRFLVAQELGECAPARPGQSGLSGSERYRNYSLVTAPSEKIAANRRRANARVASCLRFLRSLARFISLLTRGAGAPSGMPGHQRNDTDAVPGSCGEWGEVLESVFPTDGIDITSPARPRGFADCGQALLTPRCVTVPVEYESPRLAAARDVTYISRDGNECVSMTPGGRDLARYVETAPMMLVQLGHVYQL